MRAGGTRHSPARIWRQSSPDSTQPSRYAVLGKSWARSPITAIRVLRYAERWLEAWDEYRVIPEEFLDAGDQVVVIYRAVGRGKGSGVAVERRNAHLWTFRDGRAVRLEIFATPEEALEAAGLSE